MKTKQNLDIWCIWSTVSNLLASTYMIAMTWSNELVRFRCVLVCVCASVCVECVLVYKCACVFKCVQVTVCVLDVFKCVQVCVCVLVVCLCVC